MISKENMKDIETIREAVDRIRERSPELLEIESALEGMTTATETLEESLDLADPS